MEPLLFCLPGQLVIVCQIFLRNRKLWSVGGWCNNTGHRIECGWSSANALQVVTTRPKNWDLWCADLTSGVHRAARCESNHSTGICETCRETDFHLIYTVWLLKQPSHKIAYLVRWKCNSILLASHLLCYINQILVLCLLFSCVRKKKGMLQILEKQIESVQARRSEKGL